MDTTDKYIKMCEEAKKLQEQWKMERGDFYIIPFAARGYSSPILLDRKYRDYRQLSWTHLNAKLIWLFRQDDLEKMIKNFHYQRSLQDLHKFSLTVSFAIDSPEKLRLAFVMYEKYGKNWDNEKEEWSKGEE